MSIRVLILTEANDGTKFRVAAHAITHYYRHPNMDYTRVNAYWDVAETPEQIDRYFLINDVAEEDASWQPQEVDESHDADGVFDT